MENINLLIQYVNDARPARQAEYDECLRRNLANPHVRHVHNLQEAPEVVVPEEFRRHPKYRQHDLHRWMTYRDAFDYANGALAGEICCLANLDIFLDPVSPWEMLQEILQQKLVLCLSRIEFNADGTTFLEPGLVSWAFANSQDAWLFRAPIAVERCDFSIGTLGCDNAIAHRIKEAGYFPLNAAQRFKIFHYDRARGKSMANQAEIHARDRKAKGASVHPEREGQYLLPDCDSLTSVDQLLERLKVSQMERYSVICDVLNRFVRLKSPDT